MMDSPFVHHSAADHDTEETQEWLDAMASVVQYGGTERAQFLLNQLAQRAQKLGIGWQPPITTPYVNTIDVAQQAPFPGGEQVLLLEQRFASIVRWNALAMVVKANRSYGELGGHI